MSPGQRMKEEILSSPCTRPEPRAVPGARWNTKQAHGVISILNGITDFMAESRPTTRTIRGPHDRSQQVFLGPEGTYEARL